MSDYETLKGKIRKIDLQGMSAEEYAERIIKEKGVDIKINEGPFFYQTYIDILKWYDDWEEGRYITVDGVLYLIYDTCDIDSFADYIHMTPIEDNTYEFHTSFYNGGTCLNEMIEDEIRRLNGKS